MFFNNIIDKKNYTSKLAVVIMSMALLPVLFVSPAEAGEAGLINYQPTKLPNPDDGWKPLSPAEMSKRTLALTFKAAEAAAEAVDSMHMSYVSDKLFDVIEMGHKVINRREHFRNKYNMSLEVKGEHALLVYKKRY